MVIIVVAVITQGFRVPAESRGEVKSYLIINSGFFQAVGVISFGEYFRRLNFEYITDSL